MARYTGPVCRLCRRETTKLFLKGERCYTPKCAIEKRNYIPGQHGKGAKFRRKMSDYGVQLREKQKARRVYGVLERQFRRYFENAIHTPGLTGEVLLQMLELRLDNVIYRLGFADSRAQARQLVTHGHVFVNGHKLDIASALLKDGDVVTVRPQSQATEYFKMLADTKNPRSVPAWLSADVRGLTGRVLQKPVRTEIDTNVNEQLIVEYYSR